MKLLFAWLSMVYLEPAGPVPAQTLACHSGSRESISSCDLKIPKEVAPASQSGYQVSFSINSVHFRCVLSSCSVGWRQERGVSPLAQPALHFQRSSHVLNPHLLFPDYVRSTYANVDHALDLPGADVGEVTEFLHSFSLPSSAKGQGIPCLPFGHQWNFVSSFQTFMPSSTSLREWRKFLQKSLSF